MSAARVIDLYGSPRAEKHAHPNPRDGVPERGGAFISGQWVPSELWVRICGSVKNVADLQAFRQTCVTALHAVNQSQSVRFSRVREVFGARAYTIPPALFMKSFAVHPVIPHGKGVILIVDESDSGRGVELAWIEAGTVLQTPLGIIGAVNAPATTVSNVQFAPSGDHLAMLVMLRNENQPPQEADPLKRLRGIKYLENGMTANGKYTFKPSDDCTVQIVDLIRDSDSIPLSLKVYTYSHVFVPEYGFDLVWRPAVQVDSVPELVFVAMLHSGAGAATYLVRWENFKETSAGKYVFMACIEGASDVFVMDKKFAICDFPCTQITSRVELSQDGMCIFFDTVTKFGVLQFDQLETSTKAFVIRADMNNDPDNPGGDSSVRVGTGELSSSSSPLSPTSSKDSGASSSNRRPSHSKTAPRLKFWGNFPRITRMSPDGSLVCTILNMCRSNDTDSNGIPIWRRSVEMLCNKTGESLFLICLKPVDLSNLGPEFPFDKSVDIAHRILGFSKNSSLIWVRDAILSTRKCRVSNHLPCFIDSRSGRVVQDFGTQHGKHCYQHVQIAPNALTVYGTRYEQGCVFVDAIDVITGDVLEVVNVTGRIRRPYGFSSWCQFHVSDDTLLTISRGDMDVLWETTRGSVGCGWKRVRSKAVPHLEQ